MPSDKEKTRPEWWRARFSLRTLAIVVTLVCGYFAAWGPTKDAAELQAGKRLVIKIAGRRSIYGGNGFTHEALSTMAPAPLIISLDLYSSVGHQPRYYYLWLFGPMFKLPFESKW